MEIRFLRPGEDAQWFECLGEAGAGLTRDPDFDPRCHIVAEEGGRFIGGMELALEPPLVAVLLNPTIRTSIAPGAVLKGLVDRGLAVAREARLPKVRLMVFGSNPGQGELGRSLPAIGFSLAMTKRVYRLVLPCAVPRPGRLDEIRFESLHNLGQERFAEIYTQAFVPETSVEQISAAEDFTEIKSFAVNTGAFDPNTWFAAFVQNQPIGITMPQRHDRANMTGSNFYLGIVAGERGKGFGSALHYYAVQKLLEWKVRTVIGSTGVTNEPMARIFTAFGYEPAFLQDIYYYRGRPEIPISKY